MSATTRCRSCGAPIVFAYHWKKMSKMVFDAKPVTNWDLLGQEGRARPVKVHVPHHATCPDAEAWRRPK